MSIEIRNVSKHFGDFRALKDVSLTIDSGELVALLGPSGCGKTTLLRIIAGLETADAGSILFSGEDTTDVHVRERQVGFVFQHYALFRHMTVFENVAFGLRVKPRGLRPSEVAASSRSRPCACISGISSRATKGAVTNIEASTIPGSAKSTLMPAASSAGPNSPCKP